MPTVWHGFGSRGYTVRIASAHGRQPPTRRRNGGGYGCDHGGGYDAHALDIALAWRAHVGFFLKKGDWPTAKLQFLKMIEVESV